ncbi:MAG TPA: hypothetical protein VEK07_21900 [Polyangiaceae bacterium]|nr:hypothetical protein [Polyangiaceae bacterium]
MWIVRIPSLGLLAVTASVAVACGNSSESLSNERVSSVRTALTSGARIWLAAPLIARLQQRAAASDPAWTALAAECDSDASGTINDPSGEAYPDPPDIGQGYEGSSYLPEAYALGLCYRTAAGVDDVSAARWAQAGARLLSAMATPVSSGGEPPSTNSGYGIRNYGVGMAVGYDWLSPALDATTAAAVQASLEAWISWYDASGFINDEPIGNYFAGYLFAKGAAAIALQGADPSADTWWSDITTTMWPQLAGPAYGTWLAGGGWPEGWEYGPLATENIVGFEWAASTGKSMTWWTDVPLARGEAQYIPMFSWPSRMHMDDRGTIHAQPDLYPSASTEAMMATVLDQQQDPLAPIAHGAATDILAHTNEQIPPWQKFLFWDPAAKTEDPSTLPVSYEAHGPDHVAMRSSWATSATWASFISGPYIDAPYSGEEYFDEGSLAIAASDTPVLVNATGWLPQAAGDDGENFVYNDTWGAETRLLNNTFYVSGLIQDQVTAPQSTTHVERYEDGVVYVRARGAQIEQMYTPSGVMTQWTRDVVYVRPGRFVVYDRTTVSSGGTDQWLAWHVPNAPTQSTSADGTPRFDVATGGTIRSLLPTGTKVVSTDVLDAVTRVELHSSAASQDWLTAVTVGESPAVETLSAAVGNVTSGNVLGAHVEGSARETVVLFAADHAAAAPATGADYAVAQAVDADHMIFDVAAGTYAVTAVAVGGKLAIHVTQGGSFSPSSQGTLAFTVYASGGVGPAAESWQHVRGDAVLDPVVDQN